MSVAEKAAQMVNKKAAHLAERSVALKAATRASWMVGTSVVPWVARSVCPSAGTLVEKSVAPTALM